MRSRPRSARRHRDNQVENLEARCLLSTVTVNTNQTVRSVDPKVLGINVSPWDGNLSSSQTSTLTNAMGTTAVRIGGGSYVDNNWHFNLNNQSQTVGQEANFIAAHGNIGIITVNYGTASPQEAAAELAYFNGSPSDTTVLGTGEQWSTTSNSWVDVDWKTVGYWASLRAAATVSGNPDNLNFLRLNHPASYGFHYWEMGNEVYGNTWETDKHGDASDHLPMPAGGTRAPWDPTTYISFSKQFATLAHEIDPTISVGIDSQTTDSQFTNWISNLLTQCSTQGFTPGFISDHLYDQQPGQENDTTLLNAPSKVTGSANPFDWVERAAKYRSLINTYIGSANGAGIELLATEFNSVSSSPGKQSTSLVNAVFGADSIGEIMQTEYNGAFIWQLHNGTYVAQTNKTNLYGWRTGGDYGVLGSSGFAPTSSLNEPFPDYFAEQIVSKFALAGGTVVSAISSDSTLDVFAVKETNGHLELMVVNKSKTGLANDTTGTPAINTATFTLNGYTLSGQSSEWQYGSVEDNIQKNSGSSGATSLTLTTPGLSVSGSTFTMGFPSLSISVLDLAPGTLSPPNVVATAYSTTTFNQITVTFDQNLDQATLSPGDLTLTNLDGGALPTVQSVQFNPTTKIATFTLNSPANDNYSASIAAGSVNSAGGIALATGGSTSFFILAGDANHDRFVDASDQAILTAHLGQAGDFSQGDFNGDGTVNLADQTILSTNLHILLPAAGSAYSLSATSNDDAYRIVQESASLTDMFAGMDSSATYRVVSGAIASISFAGGNGNDSLAIDFGSGDPVPAGGFSYDGGAGINSLSITGSSGADTADFAGSSVNFGDAVISLVSIGPVTFDGKGGFDNLTVESDANVTFPATSMQTFDSLTIAGNAAAAPDVAGGLALIAHTLSITGAGTLDLNDNDLILDYSGASRIDGVQALINSARASNAWTGTGLTSSAARNASPKITTLGAMEATDYKTVVPGATTFDGQPIDNTAVLVKYTYYGDANFNGKVDGGDYSRIDTSYNNESTAGSISGWMNGDFDGNGKIDGADYALIDAAFGGQGSVALRTPSSPVLPPIKAPSAKAKLIARM